LIPAAIAPERFQTQQGFVAGSRPELAGAFEPALVLPAGRFNGPGTHRVIGQLPLRLGRLAFLTSFPGFEHLLVFHAGSVVLEVFDRGLDFLLLGFQQAGLEFGQAGNDRDGLVVAELLQQRRHPGLRFGGAAAIEVVRHRPKVLLGMEEIQALARVGETVLGQVPDPEGAIGEEEHQLGLAQATSQGFAIELGAQGLDAQAGGGVTALGDDRAFSGGLAPVVQAKDCGQKNLRCAPPACATFFNLEPGTLNPEP